MQENWNCITSPHHSFAGLPVCTQLNDLEADVAIIGIHYVTPYHQRSRVATAQTSVETASYAIRRQSSIFIENFFVIHVYFCYLENLILILNSN
jgi:hypothetical protein